MAKSSKTTETKTTKAPAKMAVASEESVTKKAAVSIEAPVSSKKDAPQTNPSKSATTEQKFVSPFDDNIHQMIQEAAYYIAERNNFAGDTHAYWVEAESQIIRMISR